MRRNPTRSQLVGFRFGCLHILISFLAIAIIAYANSYFKYSLFSPGNTLHPGTLSRLQEKSLAAFHAALSLFSCDQVPPVVRPGGRTLIRSCILQLFFFLFPALDSCSLFLATKNLKAFILAHDRLFFPEIWKKCPSLILR